MDHCDNSLLGLDVNELRLPRSTATSVALEPAVFKANTPPSAG